MQSKIQNIVVGTSLELASDAVVRTGVELARRLGAQLHLFHAHSLPLAYFAAPSGLTTVGPDLLEAERQVRDQLMNQQLERLGLDAGAVAAKVIEAGAPHRMLLETADQVSADLVVLGTSEAEGLSFLGSTTDRVLRKAAVPVWVVDGRPRLPPVKILAPVDLSPLSEECMRHGLHILSQVCDQPPEIETLFVLSEEELKSSQQFSDQQLRRMAQEELARFLERVDPGGVHHLSAELREGGVRAEILRDVEEKPVDLVILGTHGRSGFERFLLGSVATDVASRARASVLVIPPEAAGAED